MGKSDSRELMGVVCDISSIKSHNMRSIILAAIFCSLFYMASATKFARLQAIDERLGCSIQESLACADEIQLALEDCSHITDINSIITCINDILGASDCQKCVCDVLSFLCP